MRFPQLGLTSLLLVALSACSSAAPAASTPADPAESEGTATTPPPATEAPDEGNGGGTSEYCLNSIEQVSSALGVEVTSAEGAATEGLGGGCMYLTASGASVYTLSVLDGDGAADAFEGYRQYEGAEEISGIGDAALYLPLGETFGVAFRKGDVVASGGVTSAEVTLTGDELRAAVEELARQAADGL